MKPWLSAVALSASLVTSNEALAGVIVVNAAGGGDFTQIQPAVHAAADGDTILVKPGVYSGFTISLKSLTVIGEVGGDVDVAGSVLIHGSSEQDIITLARIKTHGSGTANWDRRGISVIGCLGPVRIADCEFTGAAGSTGPALSPGPGVVLDSSSNVAIVGCTMTGGDGVSDLDCSSNDATAGAMGLWLPIGSAAVYECISQGGDGGDGGGLSGVGGVGVYHWSYGYDPSFLFVARSNIHGGDGGDTVCPDFGCPHHGGPGYHTVSAFGLDPDPIGWVFDLMIGGGAAGQSINGPGSFKCDPVSAGPPFSGIPPFSFSVPSLGFSMPAIAREGEFVTVTFTGPPGARVHVNDRLTTTFEAVASWRGVLLAPFAPDGAPTREIKWGVIPASGELKRTYHVPQLPPGVEAQTRFLQAYRIGANGITLGTFRPLTILDSAF